jgi:hypothetical protein
VIHNNVKPNIICIIRALNKRILEHSSVLQAKAKKVGLLDVSWEKPPSGMIKINTDAALMDNAFALALVANDSGSICLSGSKKIRTSDSVVAEPAAILWALQVAKLHKFLHIIIESDAKVCTDALSVIQQDFPWAMEFYCHDIAYFSNKFASINF